MRTALTVARVGGVPVAVHVSFPVVLGALAALLPRAAALWGSAVALVFLHELGHAWMARRLGLRVHRIVLHGAGGACVADRAGRVLADAALASGGLLAQLAVLAAWWGGTAAWPAPLAPPWTLVDVVLGPGNLLLMAVNLLPLHPLDGALLWPGAALLGRAVRGALRGGSGPGGGDPGGG